MTSDAAQTAGPSVTSWFISILVFLGIVAAIAYPVAKHLDAPYLTGLVEVLKFVGIVVAVGVVVGVYFSWQDRRYESAAKALGFSIETGVLPKPEGADSPVNLLIRGEFDGHPFVLWREVSRLAGQKNAVFSVVEWRGDDIRLPDFSLHVAGRIDSALERTFRVGTSVEGAFAALTGRAPSVPVEFGEGSPMARRSKLFAADPNAARALFTPLLCEAFEPVVEDDLVRGGPGYLRIRRSGFPQPELLKRHLERADGIRKLFPG